jgi:hypothetical protein
MPATITRPIHPSGLRVLANILLITPIALFLSVSLSAAADHPVPCFFCLPDDRKKRIAVKHAFPNFQIDPDSIPLQCPQDLRPAANPVSPR